MAAKLFSFSNCRLDRTVLDKRLEHVGNERPSVGGVLADLKGSFAVSHSFPLNLVASIALSEIFYNLFFDVLAVNIVAVQIHTKSQAHVGEFCLNFS